METFEKELTSLINKRSMENESNTPDFILAKYICGCLAAFNVAVQQREIWSGYPSTEVSSDDIKMSDDEQAPLCDVCHSKSAVDVGVCEDCPPF